MRNLTFLWKNNVMGNIIFNIDYMFTQRWNSVRLPHFLDLFINKSQIHFKCRARTVKQLNIQALKIVTMPPLIIYPEQCSLTHLGSWRSSENSISYFIVSLCLVFKLIKYKILGIFILKMMTKWMHNYEINETYMYISPKCPGAHLVTFKTMIFERNWNIHKLTNAYQRIRVLTYYFYINVLRYI